MFEYIHTGVTELEETDFKEWKPALIRLLFMVSEEKNDSLSEKIKTICIQKMLYPQPNTKTHNADLADYMTFNLIPCGVTPGNHGGSRITVKINPDFNLLHADTEVQRSLLHTKRDERKIEVYHEKLAVYEREMAEYEAKRPDKSDSWSILFKPIKPFKPLCLSYTVFETQQRLSVL